MKEKLFFLLLGRYFNFNNHYTYIFLFKKKIKLHNFFLYEKNYTIEQGKGALPQKKKEDFLKLKSQYNIITYMKKFEIQYTYNFYHISKYVDLQFQSYSFKNKKVFTQMHQKKCFLFARNSNNIT